MALSVSGIYGSVKEQVDILEGDYAKTIDDLANGEDMSLSDMLAAQAQLADYSNMQSFLQKTVDNARKMTDETIKANNA